MLNKYMSIKVYIQKTNSFYLKYAIVTTLESHSQESQYYQKF